MALAGLALPPIPLDYILKANHQDPFPYLATSSEADYQNPPPIKVLKPSNEKPPLYPIKIKLLILTQGFINCHLLLGHVSLLSIQRQSIVPLGHIYLPPPLPFSLPLLPFPLSLVFVSYSLPFVPLR